MKILYLRFKEGLSRLKDCRNLKICTLFALLLLYVMYVNHFYSIEPSSLGEKVLVVVYAITGALIVGVLPLFWIVFLGTPRDALSIEKRLEAIGMKNKAGEVPMLVRVLSDPDNPKITIYRFHCFGIPRSDWDDKKDQLEATLNASIVKTKYSNGRSCVDLYIVKGDASAIPDQIIWNDEYLASKESVIVLGEGVAETVYADLNISPHILIGGSSGSGKTVLFKNVLHQCYRHGAKIIICDFKGGVDYSPYWHKISEFCDSHDDLIGKLTYLTDEISRRKDLLLKANAKNIYEYNEMNEDKLPRVIFGCDELSEMLDKTGLSKDDKAKVALIEANLATIARQGRAFGIHLVLATQRPDATVLPGQIKNNMDIRICGRADNTLSMIILDSTIASDEIEKDERGKFILPDGTVFRGYFMDE